MEFFTLYKGGRPVRLSGETRQFAYESLHHRYGLQTRETPCVSLDGEEDFDALTPLEKYDRCLRRIAEEAPIRICEGEKISGAATLGDAISHVVPARRGGVSLMGSISHLTADFAKPLRIGLDGMLQEIKEAAARNTDPEKEPFYRSLFSTVESFRIWHRRYLDALPKDSANYRNLLRVPFCPPTGFYEAVQSLWFCFAFLRLCGNWPGIGRIDVLLGDYLKNDLEKGVLTLAEAREILAHFFIKGCEWVCGGNYGSGDAQHYQNLVLAGKTEDGREAANEVTYLVLDIIEELGISDFPTTVRISRDTDPALLTRLAEVIRHGGGVIAVYNEETVLKALRRAGYPVKDSLRFANDGCWEVQVPGETYFRYFPFDGLSILQNTTLKGYEAHFDSYEALEEQFLRDLYAFLTSLHGTLRAQYDAHAPECPCTAVSLFEDGCVESGRSYLEFGPHYTVVSPHIGGMPDIANSLYAIKKAVFEDHLTDFDSLMRILRENWEGEEALRLTVLNRYGWWGNDEDEVDALAARLTDRYAEFCHGLNPDPAAPFKYVPGISTFGRQIEWIPSRLATPFGKKKGEILSGNFSPTPGTDFHGATAIIKSYCKCDMTLQTTGAALDIKLLPSCTEGDDGLRALAGLLRGFVQLGGYFMQPDVIDNEILKAAQENPEAYQTLSVRVSGWNARFVTLNREWQQMIIERDAEGV